MRPLMYGFCPLASGSKGNCLYLGTKKTKILIDAGISTKNIKERLSEIDVCLSEIDAVFVSHEHGDHIMGLKVLAFKYKIPIVTNTLTAKAIVEDFGECPKFKIFQTGEPFDFHDLHVHPFSVQHDARDPVAFTLQFDQFKLGICTDLGFVTSLVTSKLSNCNVLYVEANHKPSMVHASSRPMSYKQRVLSRSGHLSNEDCAELLSHVAHDALKQVYLAHLSSECNSPEVALTTVTEILNTKGITLPISVCPQEKKSTPTLFS